MAFQDEPSPLISAKSDDVVISVTHVSKKFCRNLKRSMLYGMRDLSRSFVGMRRGSSQLRKDEFWALDDISFELKRGECLGLIGQNGCGKSTLLRLLTGIFPPDKGEIMMKGRVGGLIALGAGFHPHLTGRENIYLNGSILGLSQREINAKFDQIVDFAEIDEFLDAPLSTYSSGMRVRLGFAVASQIQPDILLIDEVLAVGDMGFRAKCLNAISDLLRHAAVIFVSHIMPQVIRISTQAMVLNHGRVAFHGEDVKRGVDMYMSLFDTGGTRLFESGKATVSDVTVHGRQSDEMQLSKLQYGDELRVSMNVTLGDDIPQALVRMLIWNEELRPVMDIIDDDPDSPGFLLRNTGQPQRVTMTVPHITLNAGRHSLVVTVREPQTNEIFYRAENIAPFQMLPWCPSWANVIINGNWETMETEGISCQ